MTVGEYLDRLLSQAVKEEKVEIIENNYSVKLSDLVKKIVSFSDETIFLDDGPRVLSYPEIVNASSELHVDFISKGIIPLFDCNDNDFVVYSIKDNSWERFNIIDEIEFKKRAKLEEVL